ncbi:MAG TPA: DUF3108 domain-containing protein [Longimicrobium sp.]|jgi:hypothetical protein
MYGTLWGLIPAAMTMAAALAGPDARPLPFAPGDQCVYRGSGVLGRIGTGVMAVEAEEVDGRSVYLLRFDFRGRLGPVTVEDHTRSWFDPADMASLRYTKRERTPVSSRNQDVRMDRSARRWTAADNTSGALVTGSPLDELSFLYFIRTLPLENGASYSLARHYEARRNPVTLTVIGRGPIRVPAGQFTAIEVLMRVKDPARYGGEGVIQLHLTDDARKVPLRIESAVPRAGRMVLSLESGTGGCSVGR